ncbi:hypothetical protein HG536_0A00620 [Torulaspora globosa]|uniref:PhoD-like phosphatase domain-containing protein n=1 Tax=Torulaspora globosa TaxID=48254 RepID=A0A7G3Z9Q9_9SACH|nr:uncharacterized protein HG536_0A00620 [Torulaspora globosa]QLL30245.1 hypothetical protein HG536_0A00620 [Torulaspora globosa]
MSDAAKLGDNWFDEWKTESLYRGAVENCNDCIDGSPIAGSGIIVGPILRLRNVDYESFAYKGSILVVTRSAGQGAAPRITYQTGYSYASDCGSKDPQISEGEFKSELFHEEESGGSVFHFFRYDVEIPLADAEQMVKYKLDGEWRPHFRFFIPSKTANFNMISYSCNGFSLSVDTTHFEGSLWFDILNKHAKIHYNVMLGGGDQIYSDSIKIYCEKVKQWTQTTNPVKKFSTVVDDEFRRQLNEFYLTEYLEWYGYGHWKGSTPKSKCTQKCFPIAMASIPSINIWDDHDIIDGFGSYSHTFMKTDAFSSIGKAAYKYYMLFQHHVSVTERKAYLEDPMWIIGPNSSPYIREPSHSIFTRVGPNIGLLGLDCRTERKLKEIVSEATYDVVFEKLVAEANNAKMDHLFVMLGVPIAYPRLVLLEWLFSSSLLAPVRALAKRGILGSGLINEFNGDIELLDDLNDHWCARHHKKERNGLVARLQDYGAKYGIRITILSGDVHLASIGRFMTKRHRRHIFSNSEQAERESAKVANEPENDMRLMFNVISSAVVNTPPPNGMVSLLQSKAEIHHFDYETDEDAVPIFNVEVSGSGHRKEKCFLNKRNWSDIIPVENAMKNEYLSKLLKAKVGDLILPGVVSDSAGLNKINGHDEHTKEIIKNGPDKGFFTYPITEKGVIVSLNMETDMKNPDSKTTKYCLPIPELRMTCDSLSHSGLKHWNFH